MMKKIGLTILLGFPVAGILVAVLAKTSDEGTVRSRGTGGFHILD
jgi:hypothetical protein